LILKPGRTLLKDWGQKEEFSIFKTKTTQIHKQPHLKNRVNRLK